MDFGVLGPLKVERAGVELELKAPQLRRVLGVLLVNSGRTISVDAIAEALWDEADPSRSINAVHVYVSRLRQRFVDESGEFRLLTVSFGYRLEVTGTVDSLLFKQLIAEAGEKPEPAVVAPTLSRALDLWRGPALVDLRGRPVFDLEAEHLERLRLDAEEDWLGAELELGRHRQMIDRAEAMVRQEPLRERRWGQLMTALYRAGRQAEALRAYRRARDIMVEELGVEPSPGLASLEMKLLQQDPSLVGTIPAVRLGDPSAGNLPSERDAFVGRGQETAELEKLLRGARLVSVVGLGGVGKSRLARRVASEFADVVEDGVWWVPFSEAVDDVAGEVGAAFGLHEPPDGPWEEHLFRYLHGRRLLLVLDAVEFALNDVASFVERLQTRLDDVIVLATSRTPLGLSWEVTYRLSGLATPAPDAEPRLAMASDSVRLFLARSQLTQAADAPIRQSLQMVKDVVRQLDGLPLGIELVAAALRHEQGLVSALGRVESMFRDTPGRHRSLRATFDWSLEQCSEEARRLFDRLFVFAGRFYPEDVEAITSTGGGHPAPVGRVLEELALRSLVESVEDGMYILLDPVREHARERAQAAGVHEEVRRLHADYFQLLVERLRPELARGVPSALDLVDERLPDIRQALLLRVRSAPKKTMIVLFHLREFMLIRGHRQGLAELTRQLLQMIGVGSRRAQLIGRCMVESCMAVGRYPVEQEDVLEEALRLGEMEVAVAAAWDLTYAANNAGMVEKTARYGRVMNELAERMADHRLRWWARLAKISPHDPDAEQIAAVAAHWFHASGDFFGEAWALWDWAAAAVQAGNYPAAEEPLVAAGERFTAMKDHWGLLAVASMSAFVAVGEGDADEAERNADRTSHQLARLALDHDGMSAEIASVRGHAALIRGEVARAHEHFTAALFPPEKWTRFDPSTAVPWALVGMAETLAAMGDWNGCSAFAVAAQREGERTRWRPVMERAVDLNRRARAVTGPSFDRTAAKIANSADPVYALAEMTNCFRAAEDRSGGPSSRQRGK